MRGRYKFWVGGEAVNFCILTWYMPDGIFWVPTRLMAGHSYYCWVESACVSSMAELTNGEEGEVCDIGGKGSFAEMVGDFVAR